MTDRGFNLPLEIKIPVERQQDLEERYNRDLTYTQLKEAKIAKTWRNLKSNLRQIGDFLWTHFMDELSYEQISNELGMTTGSIKQEITKLNFWREYPIRMIPIRKKKGFIKSSLKNPEDTEEYLKRKSRTIASMDQVYTNVDNSLKVKQKKKETIKVKNQA